MCARWPNAISTGWKPHCADIGVAGNFFLMLSNGGLTHVAEAKRAPVQLLESGPAAGALAGAWFGRNAGLPRVLAFDMGGTTAKLALVDGGEPLVAWGFEAARARRFLRGSGLPIQIATIELIEIGAGGGSIARRSELGTLNVGPDSAGADPGPACYARGGDSPTVTDADLLLGYLDAEFFLGGAMRIDAARAAQAMRGLGDALGIDSQRTAFGVHDVVNENMVGAARVAIAERGRVPHEYALMATGGAAPVHAWQVARKLGITRVVCPPGAGVGSTIGMLMAPARVDRVASLNVPLAAADWREVARIFARLDAEAEAVIADTGAALSQASARRLADMRYIGQGSEITVALPDSLDADAVRAAFEAAYRALFSRTPPGAAIQFVALRLALSAPMPGSGGRLALTPRVAASRKGTRPVWFPEAGGFVETAVYDRYALHVGRHDRRSGGVRGEREHVRHWPRRPRHDPGRRHDRRAAVRNPLPRCGRGRDAQASRMRVIGSARCLLAPRSHRDGPRADPITLTLGASHHRPLPLPRERFKNLADSLASGANPRHTPLQWQQHERR